MSASRASTLSVTSNPLSKSDKAEKKRKSNMFGFLTLKEPSTAALEQYAEQQRKLAQVRGGKATAVGIQSVSSQKLPPTVPKVNSRWNGLPEDPRSKAATKSNRDSFMSYASDSRQSGHGSTSTFSSSSSGETPDSLFSARSLDPHRKSWKLSTTAVSTKSAPIFPSSRPQSSYTTASSVMSEIPYCNPHDMPSMPPLPSSPLSGARSFCATPPDYLPATPSGSAPISGYPRQKSIPLISPKPYLPATPTDQAASNPRSPHLAVFSPDDTLVPAHLIRAGKAESYFAFLATDEHGQPLQGAVSDTKPISRALAAPSLSPTNLSPASATFPSLAYRARPSIDSATSAPSLSRASSARQLVSRSGSTASADPAPRRPITASGNRARSSSRKAEVAPWEVQGPDEPDPSLVGPPAVPILMPAPSSQQVAQKKGLKMRRMSLFKR